jgi:phytoene desaturase
MKVRKCAVIGGGLGGLSAAIYARSFGFEVDLYEKNDSTGGKAGTLQLGNYRFDTGPSLLTMPFVLENIFTTAGTDIKKYMTIVPLLQHCRYFFDDKTSIIAYADTEKFGCEIDNKTSDTPKALAGYLSYVKKIYELSADLFLFNDFHDPKTFLTRGSLKTLFNIKNLDSLRTVHTANSSFFTDPRNIQLFDRYATYNGSNPYMAPATLNIIPHVEYNMGSYTVKEGIFRIPQALDSLSKESGVRIITDTKVEKILTDYRKKVTGLKVCGEKIGYDAVISNIDALVTYQMLLCDTESPPAKRYARLEPSSSAIVFYWGIKGAHDILGIHNILFSGNYKEEFKIIFTHKKVPDDPTVYIYISSKFKKDDAPKNAENWFVMINTPYNSGQKWEDEVNKSRNRIFKKINKILSIDIGPKICEESICTPPDIESKTSSNRGSLYGISSNSKNAAFLRQRNLSKDYPGLYFCGGSVHPGGGIPLVLLSGKLAAQAMARRVTLDKS